MGRGKIEIKRIENPTNRQVTYSKRRNGIFKKAQELTVLCDAKVSLIMLSNTGKLHEYISPNISTKKIYDQYQKTLGIDLWSTHYERMQEHLRKLKEVNNRLRREIRQKMGEELNDLSVHELRGLEQKMSASLTIIRDRKVRNLEERHGNLLLDFEAKCDLVPQYELVENEGDYDSAVAFANGISNLYSFRLQPNHPNLHHHGGGCGSHDLRLA
ncbi:K-box region and MADS-box transcription factor family protein [Actinidia rufa]|uniref:K-box region and MADS-box transcription factor family protein n=1 Tax=Actinidia rufa TaxID=165716 RepID=A0A7J0F5I1_9ERIC|nr:K-box region and MADS-box transcription factor family protein [Actinidia rufa]